MYILEDAAAKLKAWRVYYPNAINPNSPYRCILKARLKTCSNVENNGDVSQQTVDLIAQTMRGPFNMGRQMHEDFPARLSLKLQDSAAKNALSRMSVLNIRSISLGSIKADAKLLYDRLSAPGAGWLSKTDKKFCVGATKAMNFIFPELLVMLDKRAAKGIGLRRYNNFEAYWTVEELCHSELQEWAHDHGNMDALIALDYPAPSTPTRIFDKCAFVMGHPDLAAIYRTLR